MKKTQLAAAHARRGASPALDLPPGHGLEVKLKALEVDDKGMRQHLQAVALDSIYLYQQAAAATTSRQSSYILMTTESNSAPLCVRAHIVPWQSHTVVRWNGTVWDTGMHHAYHACLDTYRAQLLSASINQEYDMRSAVTSQAREGPCGQPPRKNIGCRPP